MATRTRILDCTANSLLERGYTATTISAIQVRTGLARGTVQYHFPTRTELVIAAGTHVIEARLERFRHEAKTILPGRGQLDALVDLAWRDLNSPAFFTVLELWVAARTDPELRESLVHQERRFFGEIGVVYSSVLGEPYADDPRAATIVDFTIDVLTGLSMTTMLTGDLGRRETVLRRWRRAVALMFSEIAPEELVEGRGAGRGRDAN